MWCGVCQQDVPAVPFAENSAQLCCARCRTFFEADLSSSTPQSATVANRLASRGYSAEAPKETLTYTASVGKVPSPPPVDFDDWHWENDLRSAAKLLRKVGSIHNRFATTLNAGLPLDVSTPTTNIAASTTANNRTRSKSAAQNSGVNSIPSKSHYEENTGTQSPWLNWIALSVGVSVFLIGGVLLLGSIVTNRTDLWNLGLPITVLGQVALVVGLVLQLERLWHGNRATQKTLQQLDDELRQLREANTQVSSSKLSAGNSFRTHLAEGASPRMLLADLKGQLDLLAQRMPEESP